MIVLNVILSERIRFYRCWCKAINVLKNIKKTLIFLLWTHTKQIKEEVRKYPPYYPKLF